MYVAQNIMWFYYFNFSSMRMTANSKIKGIVMKNVCYAILDSQIKRKDHDKIYFLYFHCPIIFIDAEVHILFVFLGDNRN